MEIKEIEKILDHLLIIHWIEYISHRAGAVGKTNVNFDDRPFITLPSGRKIVITIKVEEYNE